VATIGLEEQWERAFMKHRELLVALVLISIRIAVGNNDAALAQLEHPNPGRFRFEVATVKPNPNPEPVPNIQFTLDGFAARSVTISMVIHQAVGIFDDRLVLGGPSWINEKKFDIQAKYDPSIYSNLTLDQRRAMLQDLLQDRFGLVIHHEARDFPLYALVLASSGPKLEVAKDKDIIVSPTRGVVCSNGNRMGVGRVEFHGCMMKDLAYTLTFQASNELGRTVVDRTGLTGRYNFVLRWTPETNAPANVQDSDAPWIIGALQKELGLDLKPITGPLDVIVIDHIEMPSAN
jgi:uncharacterized protein (TIGR03435 family)